MYAESEDAQSVGQLQTTHVAIKVGIEVESRECGRQAHLRRGRVEREVDQLAQLRRQADGRRESHWRRRRIRLIIVVLPFALFLAVEVFILPVGSIGVILAVSVVVGVVVLRSVDLLAVVMVLAAVVAVVLVVCVRCVPLDSLDGRRQPVQLRLQLSRGLAGDRCLRAAHSHAAEQADAQRTGGDGGGGGGGDGSGGAGWRRRRRPGGGGLRG